MTYKIKRKKLKEKNDLELYKSDLKIAKEIGTIADVKAIRKKIKELKKE